MFKNIIISGWPNTKDELHIDIRAYWSNKDDLAVMDSIVMKGRHIIIPERLKQLALHQLHVNHIGIRRTKLLVYKLVYWVNINSDTENHVKNCSTCLEFQEKQPKEKTIHQDIPLRPWDIIEPDVFQLINKNYLCIVDYQSKFPIIKRMEGLSGESLIAIVKIIFVEYGIPHRLMSDAGGYLISEKLKISVTVSMSSKQYHCYTTTKATGK